MNFHAGTSLGNIAPVETKATRQYRTTTVASDVKMALGMFFFGFFTSSPA
jgi:hypothetical protein